MVVFTWVHAIAHWVSFIQLAFKNGHGPKGFFLTCLTTGSGWSGHIMLFLLMVVAVTSIERIRVLIWQRHRPTHLLFILFFVFWSIHGAFSTTEADKWMTWTRTATFWQYWLIGGLLYLVERGLREVRGRYKTHISKVVQHPSNVVEIQIEKGQRTVKTGQVCSQHTVQLTSANAWVSTFIYVVQKFLCGNGAPLSLPVPLKKTFWPSTSTAMTTSQGPWQPQSGAVSNTQKTVVRQRFPR